MRVNFRNYQSGLHILTAALQNEEILDKNSVKITEVPFISQCVKNKNYCHFLLLLSICNTEKKLLELLFFSICRKDSFGLYVDFTKKCMWQKKSFLLFLSSLVNLLNSLFLSYWACLYVRLQYNWEENMTFEILQKSNDSCLLFGSFYS